MKAIILAALAAFVSIASAQSPSKGTVAPAPPSYTMPAAKVYTDPRTEPKPRLGVFTQSIHLACTGTFAFCGSTAPAINGDDAGAFRTNCRLSLMSNDDPIVWPGQPGRTHKHQFNGHGGTNSALTGIKPGDSSACPGGILNSTAYWMPVPFYECDDAMIAIGLVCDRSRNGKIYPWTSGNFYYKNASGQSVPDTTRHNGFFTGSSCPLSHCGLQWAPPNLRMIAGNASNTDGGNIPGRFDCLDAGGLTHGFSHFPSTADVTALGGIAHCTEVIAIINFPDCWDGVHLYIPSPVGSGTNGHVKAITTFVGCDDPAFPVQLPELSFNLHVAVSALADFDFMRLSSDQPRATATGTCAVATYNFCAGASLHADWWNGWNQTDTVVFSGDPGAPAKTITQWILDQCDIPPVAPSDPSYGGRDCNDDAIGSPDGPTAYTDGLSHNWYLMF